MRVRYAIEMASRVAPPRRVSQRAHREAGVLPLAAVWCAWLLLMAGANLATPLYAVYARQFHFSSLVLTSIFATYAIVLVPTLIAAAAISKLPEPAGRKREPWRIEWPRVPPELRGDFARVSATAATVWAALALYLSIVPSYARTLLSTRNLALLAVIATVALL